MRAGGIALLAATLASVLPGCGAPDPPRELVVGSHAVRVSIPAGWEVLDQGRQILIRKASAVLVLQDLGPAGPPGIRREVERAQDLWRAGRVHEAQWRMKNVPVPRDLFPTPAHSQAFWATWSKVSSAPSQTAYADLELVFAAILAHIDAMPPRELPTLADAGLAGLGHDQRRDVKARRPRTIDGREALDMETWNRLTHASPQRLLFVLNDGYLLALRTEPGADRETVKVFEAMLDTLQFAAGRVADGARR